MVMRHVQVTKPTRFSTFGFLWTILKVVASKQFTNSGPCVRELEQRLSARFNLKNIVLMNNGTTPLLFLLSRLKPGSVVLTTPFSFVATSSVIKTMGHVVKFVDIDPDLGLISIPAVKSALEARGIDAMLFTHVYGNPGEVDRLEGLSREFDVPLYFDGAHAVGVMHDGESLLSYGAASTVSFHATKLVSAGEGGALVCADDRLAEEARRWINFGIYAGTIHGVGINGKMSELQAALGLSTLKSMDREIVRRQRLVHWYREEMPKDTVFIVSPNFSYIPILLPNERSLLAFVNLAQEKGIHPRRYFHPALSDISYLNEDKQHSCPNASEFAARVLCLPSGDDVNRRTIRSLATIARLAITNFQDD
jgi:dTDP-4-amino-4,6-dideoxygalactose transaminase